MSGSNKLLIGMSLKIKLTVKIHSKYMSDMVYLCALFFNCPILQLKILLRVPTKPLDVTIVQVLFFVRLVKGFQGHEKPDRVIEFHN